MRGEAARAAWVALSPYYETYGAGVPVTVFGHGRASSIAETRFLGSGVPGSKVFVALPPARWNHRAAAEDLRAVADEVRADGCAGISLSAGGLARLLAGTPDRFEYAVFVLPAAVPVDDPAALRAVTARCLVVGHEGDDLHPAAVAYDLAAALPGAALHVFAEPWGMFRDRATLRALVTRCVAPGR